LDILIEDFGINLELAWNEIKSLNKHLLVVDFKPNYETDGDAYVFKKHINGKEAYIKVKIENGETVVISFHEDYH